MNRRSFLGSIPFLGGALVAVVGRAAKPSVGKILPEGTKTEYSTKGIVQWIAENPPTSAALTEEEFNRVLEEIFAKSKKKYYQNKFYP